MEIINTESRIFSTKTIGTQTDAPISFFSPTETVTIPLDYFNRMASVFYNQSNQKNCFLEIENKFSQTDDLPGVTISKNLSNETTSDESSLTDANEGHRTKQSTANANLEGINEIQESSSISASTLIKPMNNDLKDNRINFNCTVTLQQLNVDTINLVNFTSDQIPQTSFKTYAHLEQKPQKQSTSLDRIVTRSVKRKDFPGNNRERQNRIKYHQMYQLLAEDLETLADLDSSTDSVS
ncbi:unnamed protein product, partial [Rotaria sordida]